MKSIDKYILRQIAGSFIGGLVVLTAIVWVTQILREVDLVTSKGAALLIFVQIAGYLVPMLVLLIAPIALFIAIMQTLNKLSSDSELIVMTASGLSPLSLARPYLILAGLVSALVCALALYLTPAAIRQLRYLGTQAQANIIATVVKAGKFTQIQPNLTFHIRERASSGTLAGLVIADMRDGTQHLTYIAERGQITELPQGTFLMLENGNLQRKSTQDGVVSIVAFERYAFDLSQFTKAHETIYKPSERALGDLLNPNPEDTVYKQVPGRFRQEIHDRFSAPLYPLLFALIALAYLGQAQTTRENKTSLILTATLLMMGMRGLGFAFSGLVAANATAVILVYLSPLLGIIVFGGAALGFYRLNAPRLPQIPWFKRKTPA
jgi:lipopolysaccharide export system permease protein